MRRALLALSLVCTSLVAPRVLASQERGATALRALTDGLSTTVRVLVIGAHPDDEDTQLISFLSRGRRVETAYLSLTRGDGGQNLIGNELGEALGVIRTEELLAARRVDGAEQFFGRAYDFGFSKTADEAFAHWPKDSLLRDVLTVVREFRPHVIVSVFSGTPRDGHGQHQVAGILAREAFDLADDTVRAPSAWSGGRGAWRVAKFYRSARFSPDGATLKFNVGEYSPLLGRSYAEIAGESRSQHKSQAFGVLQRKGVMMDYLRREATHLDAVPDASTEKSMFDGIDTTWARLRPARPGSVDSVTRLATAAQAAVRADDMRSAARTLAPLARLAYELRSTSTTCPLSREGCAALMNDAQASFAWLDDRSTRAALIAAGVAIEATVQRETATVGDSVTVNVAVYDRGAELIGVAHPVISGADFGGVRRRAAPDTGVVVQPDSVVQMRATAASERVTQPSWLMMPRNGDMFTGGAGRAQQYRNEIGVGLVIAGQGIVARAPIVYRFADPVKGEIQRPLAVVPALAVTLESANEYVKAGAPIDRVLRAELRSGRALEQRVRLVVTVPPGLRADAPAELVLPALARRTVDIHVRGTLPAGAHSVSLVAESGGERYTRGYQEINYDHIRPQRLYRDAVTVLHAVDVTVPQVAVGYVTGVSDNVAASLKQLGLTVTLLDPATLPMENLSKFGTIVIGPRAYETGDAMIAANPKLLDYVKNGGRLVVQYGQGEMAQPGIMPFPITMTNPADRVTDENAPVRVLNGAGVLAAPNRIGASDFDGWVQERALYMPHTFDERYVPSLEMNDPGESPNRGAILVAPFGTGTYVYTTMSLFRQLPAGVPGAARLMMNLLAADAVRPPTTE